MRDDALAPCLCPCTESCGPGAASQGQARRCHQWGTHWVGVMGVLWRSPPRSSPLCVPTSWETREQSKLGRGASGSWTPHRGETGPPNPSRGETGPLNPDQGQEGWHGHPVSDQGEGQEMEQRERAVRDGEHPRSRGAPQIQVSIPGSGEHPKPRWELQGISRARGAPQSQVSILGPGEHPKSKWKPPGPPPNPYEHPKTREAHEAREDFFPAGELEQQGSGEPGDVGGAPCTPNRQLSSPAGTSTPQETAGVGVPGAPHQPCQAFGHLLLPPVGSLQEEHPRPGGLGGVAWDIVGQEHGGASCITPWGCAGVPQNPVGMCWAPLKSHGDVLGSPKTPWGCAGLP